jgi:glutathione S-transferase
MRIYYRPGAGRPFRVAWTLEEIGLPYDVTRVNPEEARQPEHLERHPLGRTPVLEQDGEFLFESTGLCLHLADQHPEAALIPPIGSRDRALVYQWAIFAMTEVEPSAAEYLRFGGFLGHLFPDPEPDRANAAAERFDAAATAIERALDGGFLVGGSFTVADIVAGGVLGLANLGGLLAGYPKVGEYFEGLRLRPAFERATATTEALITVN